MTKISDSMAALDSVQLYRLAGRAYTPCLHTVLTHRGNRINDLVINLLLLLSINNKATKLLKQNAISVGLMGARI